MSEASKNIGLGEGSEPRVLRADRPASITSSSAETRAGQRRPNQPATIPEDQVSPAADRPLRVYTQSDEAIRPGRRRRGEGKSRNLFCWLYGHKWSTGGLSGRLEWCTRKHCYAWREHSAGPHLAVAEPPEPSKPAPRRGGRFLAGAVVGLIVGLGCGAAFGMLVAGFIL